MQLYFPRVLQLVKMSIHLPVVPILFLEKTGNGRPVAAPAARVQKNIFILLKKTGNARPVAPPAAREASCRRAAGVWGKGCESEWGVRE